MPDPTVLTTQQLYREITSLKEIVFTRLDGMDRAIVVFQDNLTRVPTDTDKQTSHLKELIQETFKVMGERFATVEEKFKGVDTQFAERDQRVRDSRAADAAALSAALQAAKEAVGEANKAFSLSIDKSERATSEQIKQQRDLLDTNFKAVADKIDDIKRDQAATRAALGELAGSLRLERTKEIAAHVEPLAERTRVVEGFMLRSSGTAHGASALWGYILGAVGLIGTALAIVFALSGVGGT